VVQAPNKVIKKKIPPHLSVTFLLTIENMYKIIIQFRKSKKEAKNKQTYTHLRNMNLRLIKFTLANLSLNKDPREINS
jgi:hypothetical protein